jgi:hypothetical protein
MKVRNNINASSEYQAHRRESFAATDSHATLHRGHPSNLIVCSHPRPVPSPSMRNAVGSNVQSPQLHATRPIQSFNHRDGWVDITK